MTAQTFADALQRAESSGELDDLVALFAEGAELRRPEQGTAEQGREGARRSTARRRFWDADHDDGRSMTDGQGGGGA